LEGGLHVVRQRDPGSSPGTSARMEGERKVERQVLKTCKTESYLFHGFESHSFLVWRDDRETMCWFRKPWPTNKNCSEGLIPSLSAFMGNVISLDGPKVGCKLTPLIGMLFDSTVSH
jgi:hypothetical protein